MNLDDIFGLLIGLPDGNGKKRFPRLKKVVNAICLVGFVAIFVLYVVVRLRR